MAKTASTSIRLNEQDRAVWERLAAYKRISKRDVVIQLMYEEARRLGLLEPTDKQG